MTAPWTYEGEVVRPRHGGRSVTLVEGSTFCMSERSGDIAPGFADGLFFLDTRLLSRWELRIDGAPIESLAVTLDEPYTATFVGRAGMPASGERGSLLVVRRRYVGQGMRDDLLVRNHGMHSVAVAVEIAVDVDFADLFEVKENRVDPHRERTQLQHDGSLRFGHVRGAIERTVDVALSPGPEWAGTRAVWSFELAPGADWSCCAQVTVAVGGAEVEPRYRCGVPVSTALHEQRLEEWRRQVPALTTDHEPLREAVARASEDLGSLRIFDPESPDLPVVAAGAPWFMTLFGRDSIFTSWMALIVEPDLALGVLETLARFQGHRVDPETEEQPGRILHEVRFGDSMSMALGDGHIYYGTVDATPLFVMLLGELRRWGLASDFVERLLPAADRALEWIESYGDVDGDGYVEYERMTPRGLANQGWKDSWDGVTFANGEIASPPIALCEVQGYVYAAYQARAHFAHERGDEETEGRYRSKAEQLRLAFNRDFWLPDRGYFALGLDRDKRPIDALASNMGQCLWTGIVDPDKALGVAHHLLSPEMFSGWGIRTLATSMAAYDPLSYHNGSVWPHDNALIAAGLMRYGFVDEAHRVILAMLDSGVADDGRLPELFAGVSRDEVATPVGYPTSCSPQAWAAATPLMFLRTLLRFDPWVPYGKLWCSPALPEGITRLSLDRIPLEGHRVSVRVHDGQEELEGVPEHLHLVQAPRPPLAADLEGS